MGARNFPCLWRNDFTQVRSLSASRNKLLPSSYSPSAHNVDSFVERSRVESGMMIGPRIFSVGHVIYGAGNPTLHQDIADVDEAFAALTRIKAEGGPASISYKNYNLPSR
jgi:hypothetical protein